MQYFLDTNACIDYLNGRYLGVARRIREAAPSDLGFSSIVLAELRFGADKSARPAENHQKIDILAAEIEVVAFDQESARIFGQVRKKLEAIGQPIGAYDLLIAAHSLALGLTLVTDNVREFARVEGLSLANWRE